MSACPPSVETLSWENPWRGLLAYTENDREFFLGRERDAAELLALVKHAAVVVLYGQSGLGKTSVLQAGLLPALRERDFLPVRLQLDHREGAPALAGQIKAALTAEASRQGVENGGPSSEPDETLWEFFHRHDNDFWGPRNRLLTPVVVLDQFEEVFTLGQQNETAAGRVAEFAAELAALVQHNPSDAVRQKLDGNPVEAGNYDLRREAVKFIFSLREEFLPHLDTWRERIPSLLSHRYRLEPMTGEQALKVVQGAGHKILEPAVARKIVDFVSASQRKRAGREVEKREVEPALLSVVCDELNRHRREHHQLKITGDLLSGEQVNIIQNFYERAFEGEAARVRDWVEDKLLTAAGFRQRAALDDALTQGLPQAGFDQLVDRHILHLVERDGVIWLELTHDLLTDPATRSRESRQQRKHEEAQRKLVEAQRQRVRRLALVSLLFALFGITMAVLGLIALHQSHIAEEAVKQAESSSDKLAAQNIELSEAKGEAVNQAQRATNALAAALAAQDRAVQALNEANTQKTNAERAENAAEDERKKAEDAKREAEWESKQMEIEKNVATNAEQKAHVERDDFENTMNHLLASLSTELQKIGRADLLRDSTKWALDYYQNTNGTGPALDQSEASWARRFGAFTNLGYALAIQGDATNAAQAFEQGLRVARSVTGLKPGATNYLREQAFCLKRMGDLWLDCGDTARSVHYFQESLDITSRLARDAPGDRDLQRSLLTLHLSIGNAWHTSDLRTKAITEYEQAVEVAKPYINDPDFHRELAASYSKAGPLWREIWGKTNALAIGEEGTNFAIAQAAINPASLQCQSDVALAHENMGDILLAVNHDAPGALREYRQAQAIRLELVSNHGDRSNITEWNRDLMRNDFKIGQTLNAESLPRYIYELSMADQKAIIDAHNNLARTIVRTFLAQHRTKNPLLAFSNGEEIAARLARNNPGNEQLKTELAWGYLRVGDMQLYGGDGPEALTNYVLGLDKIRQLAASDPNRADIQYGLAFAYVKLGIAQRRLSHPDEAVKEIQNALAVFRPLMEQWPGNLVLRQGIRANEGNFKEKTPQDLKQLQTALAALEPEFESARSETLKEPANPSVQAVWGDDCSDMAVLKLLIGDVPAATSDAGRAVAVWQELLQSAPTNQIYKTRLERSYVALGAFQLISHDPQDAIESSRRGLALNSSLPELKAWLALGYVFSNQFGEARAVILANNQSQMGNGQAFGEALQDQLLEFRTIDWALPEIKEIQDLTASGTDPR